MKKTLLDFIQTLSIQDTKTLSQKALKTNEELGELSRKILPYENAHGTKHRLVSKEEILEEVADIILCARSIAYELGFKHEDIEDMIMDKSKVWSNIQASEARSKREIPFEIHITVEEAERESFIESCKLLEVKPIILALQNEDKNIRDVMTSSVIVGNNNTAYNEMKRISKGLNAQGFNVVREKIETVPWHPKAPSREFNNLVMPKDCYFESHFAVKIFNSNNREEELKKLCKENNLHLSKNVFKVHNDDSYTIMATYRCYEGVSEEFLDNVDYLVRHLRNNGFEVKDPITEFSLYDSKITHDAEWLKKDS